MKKIGSLVAVMVLFLLFGYNANADKTDNVYPWQSVYLQLLHEVRENPFSEKGEEVAYYMLYDVNKDDIPELILNYGGDSAMSECRLYTVLDNIPTYIDSFSYLDSVLYSCPDDNGLLLVCNRMNYGRTDQLRLENDKLSSKRIFEELNVFFYTPVADFYPGSTPITEFHYMSDYPLLSYDMWTNPIIPADTVSYPDNDPFFFTNVVFQNKSIVAVQIPKPEWTFLEYGQAETIRFNELISKIENENGGPARTGREEYRTFLVDLNQDEKLEFIISCQKDAGRYGPEKFTIVLSEENGTVYAYYDAFSIVTNVDAAGNWYYLSWDTYGSSMEEWVRRFYFDQEDCFTLKESITAYTGKKG